MDERTARALADRLLARHERLSVQAGDYLAARFVGLGSWNKDDVDRLEKAAARLVAYQQTSIDLAAAYLSQLSGVPIESEANDVAPGWRNPFITYWLHLKNGDPPNIALEFAENRARAAGYDAVRASSDSFYQKRREVTGYRRTTTAGSCDWCNSQAGSYSKSDTRVFARHDRCDCNITPIYRTLDPLK